MLKKSIYYILDASGNQLSMYEHFVKDHIAKFYLAERNIYGSSRLGITNGTINMFMPEILPSYGILGNRQYELNNHLGNVLTVINDIKYPISSDNTTISGYEVGINGISDYSPFGAPLDGRTVGRLGKYGFNSQERDDEVSGSGNSYTAEFWQYSPRLGGRWERDPKPNISISNYATFGNNPIMFCDFYGDTIVKTKEFMEKYSKGFDKFTKSEAGKEFLKDYGVGGKFEHIKVVFTLDDKGRSGYGGGTLADAISRNSDMDDIRLDGLSKIPNSQYLVKGESENYYLQFEIRMNPYNDQSIPLYQAESGADILHETQHVRIGVFGLMNLNGSIPSPENQHSMMRDKNGIYKKERNEYWEKNVGSWILDFETLKRKSISEYESKGRNVIYNRILTEKDYIDFKDTFLDR